MGHSHGNDAEWGLHTALPYQFDNVLLIFVYGIFLFWFLKAYNRLYLTIRVRMCTVLSNRLVTLEGLGSYLTYFSGATEAHATSIIHTRQSKPPVQVRCIYVPFDLKRSYSVVSNRKRSKGNMDVHIEFNSALESRIVLMEGVNVDILKSEILKATSRPSGISEFFESNHL